MTPPIGHIKIAVSNPNRSVKFYSWLFNILKFTVLEKGDWGGGWKKNGVGFWIEEAEKDQPYTFFAPGLHHICFRAKDKNEIDALYKDLLKKNIHIFNEPKAYPEYREDYYAVFFADPDGMKVELAHYDD